MLEVKKLYILSYNLTAEVCFSFLVVWLWFLITNACKMEWTYFVNCFRKGDGISHLG